MIHSKTSSRKICFGDSYVMDYRNLFSGENFSHYSCRISKGKALHEFGRLELILCDALQPTTFNKMLLILRMCVVLHR